MMPKATDSEKKMWPKAAAHTDGLDKASKFGVKKVFRPSTAPGRKTDCTTRTRNMMISSGMKIALAREMPLLTPATMITMANNHTHSIGKKTLPTKSKPTVTSSWTCKKSPMKNPPAPSAFFSHDLVMENQQYIAAHAMMAA